MRIPYSTSSTIENALCGIFLEQVLREAHAVAAETAGDAEVLAAGRPHHVEHPEGDGHETGAPSGVRVADRVVGLHRTRPGGEPRVEGAKQVRRDHRVRVDDDDRVGASVLDDRQRVGQGEPLAPTLLVDADHDRGARGRRAPGGVVRAVVGDDDDLELVARVVDRQEALHRLGDPGLLVVRGNDDGESRAGGAVDRGSALRDRTVRTNR